MKFEVDKEKNTIHVSRQFEANQSTVWASFTEKEALDSWWAPAPWKSKTTQMNFEVGGKRIYAMVGPEGEEHWAVQIFTAISAKSGFQFEDAFSDKEGVINTAMPSMQWSVNFTSQDNGCAVDIQIRAKSLSDLEQMIQMGFKEGFTATLEALATLLIQRGDNK